MNLKTGASRAQSTPNRPKNEHFFTPDTHTYVSLSGGKKCSFFEKFGVLCFLETPVLRFALLPYYWRTSCYFQKLLYTESTSTLFHSYKRLRAPLTCGRFISNASIVVSSCLTSAPVGTEILYCSPVQSRSWSYANFLSPSIIKNFFFLQRKKEIQFLLG